MQLPDDVADLLELLERAPQGAAAYQEHEIPRFFIAVQAQVRADAFAHKHGQQWQRSAFVAWSRFYAAKSIRLRADAGGLLPRSPRQPLSRQARRRPRERRGRRTTTRTQSRGDPSPEPDTDDGRRHGRLQESRPGPVQPPLSGDELAALLWRHQRIIPLVAKGEVEGIDALAAVVAPGRVLLEASLDAVRADAKEAA